MLDAAAQAIAVDYIRAMSPRQRMILRRFFVVLFVIAGSYHFVNPAVYLGIMPPQLPFPRALVYISGAAEILGGLGLILPATRRLAGWGLIALLLAVFPANIYAAINGEMPGTPFHGIGLWIRLPFQALF